MPISEIEDETELPCWKKQLENEEKKLSTETQMKTLLFLCPEARPAGGWDFSARSKSENRDGTETKH